MKNAKYRPKKSLGQNFLKSHAAIRKIIEAGEIKSDDVVLEIGPGKGALTEKLLESAGQVIAVEKDDELFDFLKEKFEKEIKIKKLILINDDILNFNAKAYSLRPRAYKIIANIPYNITGAILKKFLTDELQPSSMVLLVQKEVAQRIVAHDKKESLLSISVKAYGKPKIIAKVPARYFSPVPKVDSAIIKISNISRENFKNSSKLVNLPGRQVLDEEKFWKILKTGFAHKRKKLLSNLKVLDLNKNELEKQIGSKRAEELSVLEWINLAKL